jgi:hypothetical protein
MAVRRPLGGNSKRSGQSVLTSLDFPLSISARVRERSRRLSRNGGSRRFRKKPGSTAIVESVHALDSGGIARESLLELSKKGAGELGKDYAKEALKGQVTDLAVKLGAEVAGVLCMVWCDM